MGRRGVEEGGDARGGGGGDRIRVVHTARRPCGRPPLWSVEAAVGVGGPVVRRVMVSCRMSCAHYSLPELGA